MSIDKKEIARKIEQKGATRPCHRCGNSEFIVLDGYSNILLQSSLAPSSNTGVPAVPVAHIVCSNCGAITLHALGALDLLPQKGAEK